ncbi:cell envelope integrity protein TolA [Ramlibacter alkalitolerans]|uniref:Cell envelope integrity protein TolA n=1 Tax=Ramlibacter alkalitolerans TaxID=2039631 RepID=A0ABS1JNQ0_9BURK|nr:cell envelope integrity protein TolA [Ramlibacter alkalitolerans]MBL0425885.1 cell envelope integrity protein TolA [Ramlibacter alkalitolerans]
MDTAADRLEFAPPKQDAMWRGFALAVLAHALLVAGLTHGLKWQRESQNVAVEAELWAAVPQEAAPPAPPPPPPPPPAPAPVPAPPPVVRAPPAPDPQVQRDAQIALEREKKRELERERQEELQREREEKRKLEAKKKHEEELAKKKEQAREQARLVAEAKRKEEEKKRKEQEAKEAREVKRLAQLREENMRRMQGMAGTGAPSSTGTAAHSSGPSAGWAGRVIARVRPNIVFTDTVSGNPEAEVEVRLAPDGTIVSRRLKKSSGVKAWDDAVLRALDKTEVLPRDVDGRVPSPVVIEFKPKG